MGVINAAQRRGRRRRPRRTTRTTTGGPGVPTPCSTSGPRTMKGEHMKRHETTVTQARTIDSPIGPDHPRRRRRRADPTRDARATPRARRHRQLAARSERVRRRRRPAQGVLGGRPARLRRRHAARGHRVPATRVAGTPGDPVRRDVVLRRSSPITSVRTTRSAPWAWRMARTRSPSSCRAIA